MMKRNNTQQQEQLHQNINISSSCSRASFELPFEDPDAITRAIAMLSIPSSAVAGTEMMPAIGEINETSNVRNGNNINYGIRNTAMTTARMAVYENGTNEMTSWQKKHPNAIRSFKEIEVILNGKKLAIFLDYDGTLTPIVNNPEQAYMDEEMRNVVKEAAHMFPTAIISGRGREKVENFVKLEELYYAGSHGLDIAPPKIPTNHSVPQISIHQPALTYQPLINEIRDKLVKAVKKIEGANVEDNKFCLSVHFRNCKEDNHMELKKIVEEIVSENEKLALTSGRKVLEIRPKVNWDKGKAVEHLLKSLDLMNDDVLPLYLGDDRTDEDAFKFLKKYGRGFGILVTSKEKQTHASYTLKDPSDVITFLQELIKYKKFEKNSNRKNLKSLSNRHQCCYNLKTSNFK